MKKSQLLITVISILSGSLIACNNGGSNNGSSIITPNTYKMNAPESYNAILSNNSVLQTVNYMVLPITQKNSFILHLESSTATTVNLDSNLPISPTSCTFDKSNQNCVITISNKGIHSNNNYTITPSFGGQTLANINLSFRMPTRKRSSINLDGTWIRYTFGDTNINPINCSSDNLLSQGTSHIINGTNITYIFPDGSSKTNSSIQNPVNLQHMKNNDSLISSAMFLDDGIIGITGHSNSCNTNYYTTWTKISN